jgi:hypothetical protein
MTNQEMFDRAWHGLQSQGFRRCTGPDGRPTYVNDGGWHCAWGWVDTAQRAKCATVATLCNLREGLAATLDEQGLKFAMALQTAHDYGKTPWGMEANLRELAKDCGLVVPTTITGSTPNQGTSP